MSPQLLAGLTAFVGACLIAGWMTAFRHRSYVGWLGLAFLGLAAFVLALARAREAQELGARDPGAEWLVRVLLVPWVASFLISAVTAVRETARRLRELRQGHLEAAEALLDIVRASREAEGGAAKERAEGQVGEESPEQDERGPGGPPG